MLIESSSELTDRQEQVLRSIYKTHPRMLKREKTVKYTCSVRLNKSGSEVAKRMQKLLSEIGSSVKVTKFI